MTFGGVASSLRFKKHPFHSVTGWLDVCLFGLLADEEKKSQKLLVGHGQGANSSSSEQ
jgi:hypothetical protein